MNTARIATIATKLIVGKHMRMSLAQNHTGVLWQSFMSERYHITNQAGTDLYSIQLYEPSYFERFDFSNEFTKWAGVEVTHVPQELHGMEVLTIPAGLYAVFHHKGGPATASDTFQYIFMKWLPTSGFHLDGRPHFEVLGSLYKNNHPDSEEDIWIPVAYN